MKNVEHCFVDEVRVVFIYLINPFFRARFAHVSHRYDTCFILSSVFSLALCVSDKMLTYRFKLLASLCFVTCTYLT